MISSSIIFLIMVASLVSSAAVPYNPVKRTLQENEIIVYGSGRLEVMNKTTYADLASKFGLTSEGRPAPIDASLLSGNDSSLANSTDDSSALSKRCSKIKVFTELPTSTFLNWDVVMSSVISAKEATATVAVTEGYSIANGITVSTSSSVTVIEDFLTVSYGISYTTTWTSQYSAAYTFQVPIGKYGAVVSNPVTTRHAGYLDQGCVGKATRTYYQADSYTSKAYGGLSWVDGTISLCTSDSYPVNRCLGNGTL